MYRGGDVGKEKLRKKNGEKNAGLLKPRTTLIRWLLKPEVPCFNGGNR